MASSPSALAASDEPLRPGDRLRVSFSEERTLDGEFSVDESYRAALPLLGQTSVRDLAGTALRDSLMRAYEGQVRNQSVQVVLLRRVRVLGEVETPGLYHVDPTMTLLDAIALAGGPTPLGRLDDVDNIRDGRMVAQNIDTNDLVGSFVRSGDQIMVPQRSWLSRNAPWVVGGTVSATAILVTILLNSNGN
jgi:protein involved in polysaccharide export with SLBB domain